MKEELKKPRLEIESLWKELQTLKALQEATKPTRLILDTAGDPDCGLLAPIPTKRGPRK